ncbi:hypothetical protein [Absidia glauca]|uniref:PAS domain-containing protein n=1 Tax=Absidia glauca TaxID=4829 RepID=A0A163K326_ABSGL|nr:hypothetical protein [Absidia glauca]
MQESPILGQPLILSPPSTTAVPQNTIAPSLVDHSFPSTAAPPSSTSLPSNSTATVNSSITNIPIPAKRGHKEHVASAWKTATCVDIKHKKRGRPKLQGKRTTTTPTAVTPIANRYEVLCGTIQTPIISSSDLDTPTRLVAYPPYRPTTQTSFHHHPIESFQISQQTSIDHEATTGDTLLTPVILTSSMTQPDSSRLTTIEQHNSPTTTPVTNVILILSMEVCCAKISNDVTEAWGYYPQELAHRSIYDFVAPEDSARLSQLHRSLLDNVVEATSQHRPQLQHHQTPPPTERTTSDLFHQKTTDELAVKANGSRSFADTLHVKTRSGTMELYDICAYIGGGWGANFDDASTLTKLYIVMSCRKNGRNKVVSLQPKQQRSITTAYKPIAPLPSPSTSVSSSSISSSPSLLSTTTPRHTSHRPLDRYAVHRNRPIQPAPHDLRRVSLPAHFANNSRLNTISFRSCQDTPKINIAPMTNGPSDDHPINQSILISSPSSSSSSSESASSCTYFRPIASASTLSVSRPTAPIDTPPQYHHHHLRSAPPLSSQRMLQPRQKPYTSITYRSTPSTGPRETPAVTHPTTHSGGVVISIVVVPIAVVIVVADLVSKEKGTMQKAKS